MARHSSPPDSPSLFDLPLTPDPPPSAPGRGPHPTVRAPTLFERIKAGAIDLAILVAVGLVALIGAELLGAGPEVSDLVPVGLFLVAFSLYYTLVPLAFWGATPGMAWVGLVSRAGPGLNLAFSQALKRWFGSLLTVVLGGLPLLLAVGGRRALSDRLSGSDTFRERLG